MKYLGIDYGLKRIGLALSDEEGKLAFPSVVLSNNSFLIKNIVNICRQEKITAVVLGESTDLSGEPNEIMQKIDEFKKNLEKETKLTIHLQNEFMTSLHSTVPKLKNIFKARKNKVASAKALADRRKDDSKAAALILQRFLDKINN